MSFFDLILFCDYFQQALKAGDERASSYLDEISSCENKIDQSLTEFIPSGTDYGISYLFFGNFLAHLTKNIILLIWMISRFLLLIFLIYNKNYICIRSP